jgi:hypothetical protein
MQRGKGSKEATPTILFFFAAFAFFAPLHEIRYGQNSE